MNYTKKSLLELVESNIPNGIHTYNCSRNNVSIEFEMINYYDNTTLSGGGSVGNTTADSQMLILKFHKNLTINSNFVLSPSVRKKGMVIFVKGTITNNGTISMTARGAIAQGEDVYLQKNDFVPAIGAASKIGTMQGGITSYSQTTAPGGNNGTGRQTGSGGTGAGRGALGGNGGPGTSYSGGPGGGGGYNTANGESGANDGGKGGNGKAVSANTYGSGGGAGNPGGTGVSNGGTGYAGTGGLLVIFVDTLINNGTISSNGSKGGPAYRSGGGGSGGGSINIFYKTSYTNKTITATGGPYGEGQRGSESGNGGVGGNGTITITKSDLIEFSSSIYSSIKETILQNEFVKKYFTFFQ